MPTLKEMELAEAQNGFEELRNYASDYHAGKITLPQYKSLSGRRGTFGQRDHKKSMARIRVTGGRWDKDTLKLFIELAHKYPSDHLHLATCQSFQIHDLDEDQVCGILKDCLDAGLINYGTGGNFPRNVMCSPLAGTDPLEAFDVMPYVQAAGHYLTEVCDNPEMPKKLKTAFSGSKTNLTHASYRDLGFDANPDGSFTVFCAGGLGPNPRAGVRVIDHLDPEDVLYAIQTMINVFQKYGNNQDASKRRTRYMVEALGGEDAFRKIWLEEFEKLRQEKDLRLKDIQKIEFDKVGDGSTPQASWRILPQKQDGLYTVEWHPIGGKPHLSTLEKISEAIEPMDQVELRSSPFQTLYIINLTGKEADQILELTEEDCAKSRFETSVCCVGSETCQIGLRDSQQLLNECIEALRKEKDLPFDALPQAHFSGCRNSCGAHQTAKIGFSGFIGKKDGKIVPAFQLCLYGSNDPDHTLMGKNVALLAQEDIPAFICELARTVADSGLNFDQWSEQNPKGVETLADRWALKN